MLFRSTFWTALPELAALFKYLDGVDCREPLREVSCAGIISTLRKSAQMRAPQQQRQIRTAVRVQQHILCPLPRPRPAPTPRRGVVTEPPELATEPAFALLFPGGAAPTAPCISLPLLRAPLPPREPRSSADIFSKSQQSHRSSGRGSMGSSLWIGGTLSVFGVLD